MSGLNLRETPSGVSFVIRLQPRARREGLEGVEAGILKAAVHAPPIDGEANRALVRLISRALDVPPSAVSILRGGKSRLKSLAVAGVSAEQARRRLDEHGLG